MTTINISDEEQSAETQPHQEEPLSEAGGEQPREAGLDQTDAIGLELRVGTKEGEHAEANARTKQAQSGEVEKQ